MLDIAGLGAVMDEYDAPFRYARARDYAVTVLCWVVAVNIIVLDGVMLTVARSLFGGE